MKSIKLGDFYLSKSELNDIVQLVAKKRHTEDYQNKSSEVYIKSSRRNRKIKKG